MAFWQTLWTLWLLVAGAAFATITVVVSIKGFGDVQRMLRGLDNRKTDE